MRRVAAARCLLALDGPDAARQQRPYRDVRGLVADLQPAPAFIGLRLDLAQGFEHVRGRVPLEKDHGAHVSKGRCGTGPRPISGVCRRLVSADADLACVLPGQRDVARRLHAHQRVHADAERLLDA